MKKSISLLLALIISIGSITLIGMAGINKVSAEPPKIVTASSTPLIYVWPNQTTLPISAGTTYAIQVRISSETGRGTPHETHEPAVSTDKTYGWEVRVDFDPNVVYVSTAPARHLAKYDWFNVFHKWYWDDMMFEWFDDGPYTTLSAGDYNNTLGYASYWTALQGDPCTTTPIPTGDFPFPNQGLHSGTYYDLPYTDGIDTSALESPPGPWSGNWFMLFYFRITTLVDITSPGDGTWLTITAARLWQFDAVNIYGPVETWDAKIGDPLEPAEFPLGAEYALGLTLVAAVAYVWWIKRRKLQVVL